jgi:hypothetical protein
VELVLRPLRCLANQLSVVRNLGFEDGQSASALTPRHPATSVQRGGQPDSSWSPKNEASCPTRKPRTFHRIELEIPK